jgi:rhodanese-related sulfurtransferase
MTLSVKQLMAAANEAVPKISVDEARKLLSKENALLVDVRDGTEVAKSGKLKVPLMSRAA